MARWLFVVPLALLTLYAGGCRKAVGPPVDRNKPPVTWITSAPADSSEASYRFHVYWGGTDPDGAVVGYLVVVTDSVNVPIPPALGTDPARQLEILEADPRFTTRTDSLFVFTANDPLVLAHRIYIAAIDNEGKIDQSALETGHFIYFLARNRFAPQVFLDREVMTWNGVDHDSDAQTLLDGHLSPVIGFQDTMPDNSAIEFHWHGSDRDPGSHITGYSYELDRPMNPIRDDGSHTARFPNTAIAPDSCSICQAVLPDGQYAFSVTATDEAGALSDKTPGSSENFMVGFDPTTALVSAVDSTGAGDHPLDFSGRYTFSPPGHVNGIGRPGGAADEVLPLDIPYAVDATGAPDTLLDFSRIHFDFAGADETQGEAGVVTAWQATTPVLQSLQESFTSFYQNFGSDRRLLRGQPTTFQASPVPFDTPRQEVSFGLDVPLGSADYSGTDQLRVRARDAAGRWDGLHTYYPIAVFEVNRAPVYALPATYLQAGTISGPDATQPQYHAANADGSGSFGTVVLTDADPVLWVVYGPDDDPDGPTPLPSDWIAKRVQAQATPDDGQSGTGEASLTPWTYARTMLAGDGTPLTLAESSLEGLADGVTYRLDVELRDHARTSEGGQADPHRNWTAWSAYQRHTLQAPLTFTVCRTCAPAARAAAGR